MRPSSVLARSTVVVGAEVDAGACVPATVVSVEPVEPVVAVVSPAVVGAVGVPAGGPVVTTCGNQDGRGDDEKS